MVRRMLRKWPLFELGATPFALVLALAAGTFMGTAPSVSAQDTPVEDGTGAEPAEGAETPPSEDPGPTTGTTAPPTEASAAPESFEIPPSMQPREPPPLMVAVFPARRVPDEWVAALRDGLVAQLVPITGRRPVLGLASDELRTRIEECEEDACIGGLLAQAETAGAVFVALRRRGRTVQTTLTVRSPVTGEARGEPVEVRLPTDTEALAEALPELAAQLRTVLPDPPPEPSTLLITVSEDGALVRVDQAPVGRSPLAPFEIRTGEHEIVVTAEGFVRATRRTRIGVAEQARVDVTLQSVAPEDRLIVTDSGDVVRAGDRSITDEDWFWPVVLGGGGAVLVIVGVVIGVAVANGNAAPADDTPIGFPLPRLTGGDM